MILNSSSTLPASWGLRSFLLVGSSVLVRRLSSRCDGLLFMPSVGVFRWSRIASQGSVLSLLAFSISLLTVLTVLSTIPFDCAYPGLDITWLNSYARANLLNSFELNWGPLSENTVFGIPCLANCCFSFKIIALLVVLDSLRSTFQ